MGETEEIDRRISELTMKLLELRRSFPAHSVKPEMLMTIEETEEELQEPKEKRRKLNRKREDPQGIENG